MWDTNFKPVQRGNEFRLGVTCAVKIFNRLLLHQGVAHQSKELLSNFMDKLGVTHAAFCGSVLSRKDKDNQHYKVIAVAV